MFTTTALCVSCGSFGTVPYSVDGEPVEEWVHECPAAGPRRHLTVVR